MEQSAGNRTGTGGDHPHRTGGGIVSFFQGKQHVAGDRAGDEDTIRVTGRRHDLDPEPSHIPGESAEDVEIQFTCGASTGGDLADLQGFAAEFEKFTVRGAFGFVDVVCRDQIFSCHGSHAVFFCEPEYVMGAGGLTFPAECTASGIDGDVFFCDGDGVGRAYGPAFSALLTVCGEDGGTSDETFGKVGGSVGEFSGPVSLLDSCV